MPTEKEIIEAGACPNCWGVQAYDDQFVDFVKDQTKDNINTIIKTKKYLFNNLWIHT